MTVSTVYETSKVKCELCSHEWTAVIETEMISWPDGTDEVKLLDRLECPNCNNLSTIKRINDGRELDIRREIGGDSV